MQKYLMAIDAGTGSVRVILFDANGNELFVSQSEWTHKEDPRYPGSMDFDIELNFSIIVRLIKEILHRNNIDPENIAAISTTSMREAIVLYDDNGKEIWACANVDSRAIDEVTKLYTTQPDLEEYAYHISGQTFSLSAIPRILWVKNHMPDIYERVKYVSMLNDWITYRLTNIITVEPSNGCTTGLFNLQNRQWDSNLAKKAQLKDNIYPVVLESGTKIGHVTEDISQITGLSVNTIVVAGGGDAQLGCIGMGVVNNGEVALLGGSFWQLEYNTAKLVMDNTAKVRINCHAVPNIWQYEAIAFFPGIVMRWFRDTFCDLEKHLQNEKNESVYTQMEKKAFAVPPGSHGLVSIFSDKMNYINWKHAAPAFLNFQLDTEKFNKATFYRAIMENAAYVSRGNKENIESIIGQRITSLIFGGGAAKSDLWCQIVCDVLNVELKVPVVKESSALGTAICAGIGSGIYKDFNEAIKKVVKYEKTFTPNSENTVIYNELFKKWSKIYEKQLELADQQLTSHMWIAPGLENRKGATVHDSY